MRNLTLTFLYMEREHIGKDVSCVPYYLGKALECEVNIVSLTSESNIDLPAYEGGIHYHKLFAWGNRRSGWYKLIFFWWYLIRRAKKIDILMRFHYSIPTMVEVILYKICNPRGRAYIKCDANVRILDLFPYPKSILQKLKLALYRKGIDCSDVISCETSEVYELLHHSDSPYFDIKDKLVLAPNGFDEQLLSNMHLVQKKNEEKENVMISVGRLGAYEKNTEMILEALAKVNLRNWVFYLIGPMESEFKRKTERFFELHPEKRTKVIFTGAIYDKPELWEYYNKSKVYVLTSRHESYGLVLNEAKRFANYVLSTDVGAAKDIIADRYGALIPQDDSQQLANCLQRIVDNKTDTNVYVDYEPSELSWANSLSSVVERLKFCTDQK